MVADSLTEEEVVEDTTASISITPSDGFIIDSNSAPGFVMGGGVSLVQNLIQIVNTSETNSAIITSMVFESPTDGWNSAQYMLMASPVITVGAVLNPTSTPNDQTLLGVISMTLPESIADEFQVETENGIVFQDQATFVLSFDNAPDVSIPINVSLPGVQDDPSTGANFELGFLYTTPTGDTLFTEAPIIEGLALDSPARYMVVIENTGNETGAFRLTNTNGLPQQFYDEVLEKEINPNNSNNLEGAVKFLHIISGNEGLLFYEDSQAFVQAVGIIEMGAGETVTLTFDIIYNPDLHDPSVTAVSYVYPFNIDFTPSLDLIAGAPTNYEGVITINVPAGSDDTEEGEVN